MEYDVTCVNISRISNVCRRLQFSRCSRHLNGHVFRVQCPISGQYMYIREEVHGPRRDPRTTKRSTDYEEFHRSRNPTRVHTDANANK